MKSSLGKLRRFSLNKNEGKDKRELSPSAQADELAQAAQDMQDMRDCYDSLLSAAAAAANSAYEFSESLREMGSCLLEKTALNDDEESGRVLLMLGKVQFELQKLVDRYRSHVVLTITKPSESLLNELRTVEDMKRQCDEKRNVYEYMMAQQKEKRKSKGGKGETFTLQQLQTAQSEYYEEATLCVFRLKSLKQGQSRSLLTQAARHHAAQLNFFRKGLKSLEAVEPHVRMVTEQQHIDYQFAGLEDDGEDGEDDGVNGYDTNEDRELSFDYRVNKEGIDVVSVSRDSMEVDEAVISFHNTSTIENEEVDLDKTEEPQVSIREHRVGSYSAPLFAERKFHQAEKSRQMHPSPVRNTNTYVLPMPVDSKGSVSLKAVSPTTHARPTNCIGRTHNLWHSSPLEQKKSEKDSGDNQLSEMATLKAKSLIKESTGNNASTQLPLPSADGFSNQHFDMSNASDSKKIKRHAFSGPLMSKSSSTNPVSPATGPSTSAEISQLVSGTLSCLPLPHPSSSPKVSPGASPPLVSSPRISELHELPRPPGVAAAKPAKSPGLLGHSAPLVSRNQDHYATNKIAPVSSSVASPLPVPPLIVPRSFSIPSSNQRAMASHLSKFLESPRAPDKAEEVASPPLTPISLANVKQVQNFS